RSKQHFILEESPVDTMAAQRTMAELLCAPIEGTTNLRNEISNFQQRFDESFHEAWDRYKDLLRACHHHGFTELHQLDTFYNALNPADQDSLNAAAGGNLLERPKLTHALNQQTSFVTTAMTAILKQFQATPPPASVKAVEETCVTCGGAHLYYQCLATSGNFLELQDNIQGYVSAATVNYNQGNFVYRPLVKRMNEANMKAMQTQINMVKNELRNEMKNSIQASLSNQTNEIKNMMASLLQMNTTSTSGSGSLPSNTVSNPKGKLKAITTRSILVVDGPTVPTPLPFFNPEEDKRVKETLTDPDLADGLVLDGPSVPMPPPFINPEEDEHAEETLTDPDLAEYTIKVPPPLIDMVKNELRNEMKTSIQTSLSNQTNEIKNMMASLLQMNIASTSGSGTLPGNTIANPKGKHKAITTRSGLVTDGPTVPNPPKSVNQEEDECVKETYTDPDHAKYNIKVPPPPPVQKPKPQIQRNFILHTRDSLPPHIPYPSRMLKQKQQEIDDIQIQKFGNMFKQLHLNITLAKDLVLMPKYQKMLKALLSNKEKL
nr:reverse transcriptase domain-containing protein [Tanacetum cinerariifolium]